MYIYVKFPRKTFSQRSKINVVQIKQYKTDEKTLP